MGAISKKACEGHFKFSLIILDSTLLSLGWFGHCSLIASSFLAILLESCKSKLCAASVVHWLFHVISVTTDFCLSWFSSVPGSCFEQTTPCWSLVQPAWGSKHHPTPCGPQVKLILSTQNWGRCKLWQHQKSKFEATSPGEPPASASPQPQAAYVYGYIVFYSLI